MGRRGCYLYSNANPDKIARFISAINPIYKFLGYNDLEQVEDAPEYKE